MLQKIKSIHKIANNNLQKLNKSTYLLALIFIFALSVRLLLAFQEPNLQEGDAYFVYSQVESIKATLLPSLDSTSISGSAQFFPPLYYYVLAAFSSLIGTTLTLKILPNIFACVLIITTFLITLEMTRNRKIALLSAFISAFIPEFFAQTVNSASIFSFTIPLIFYLIYCFMRIKERKFLYQFIGLTLLLSLTSAISFLVVLGFLIYILLVKLEYKSQNRRELEAILFITFLVLWVNIIIFKNAFLFHSYSLIWQNLPSQILDSYFKQVDIVASVTGIGLLPLILGLYAIYRYMLKERDRSTYLLMAFALAVALVLWFKLITLNVGLMFLGAILVPLLGQTLNLLFKYFEKTKISRHTWLVWAPIIILVMLTSVIPSAVKATVAVSQSISVEEVDALEWLKESTPEDSVVLSLIDEGHMIRALAERQNVVDTNFIMQRFPDDIYDDVHEMYTAEFKTQVVSLMNKYGVDYIYFSPRAKAMLGLDELKYAEKDCFRLQYDHEIQIYQSLCEVNA